MKARFFFSFVFFISCSGLMAQSPYDVDRQLGAENARAVEFQYGTLEDEDRTAYIEAVGQRLVSALDTTYFPYSFEIVPTIEPNAFALPGGYCYVTTGLLELLSSEDELAGVLAHEIIHAQNRHGMKLQKKGVLPAILSIPGSVIGIFNDDLGSLINAPVSASGKLVMAKYGRTFETEADTEGIALAAKAGYDPSALISALKKLAQVIETATGYEEKKSYFNDHPITADRVERLNGMLTELRHKPIAPIGALNDIVDQLPVGTLSQNGVVLQDSTLIMPVAGVSIELPKDAAFAVYAGGVMASNERLNSALAVTRLADTTTVLSAVASLRKQLEELPTGARLADEPLSQGGLKGHRIEFLDPASRNGMTYYVWWVEGQEGTLQFTALAPKGYNTSVKQSLKSIRAINEREKSEIMQRYMSLVESRSGETLEALHERTGNTLSLDLTALINERPPKEILPEGALIRVVVEKPYF